jgi:hypothetical protein
MWQVIIIYLLCNLIEDEILSQVLQVDYLPTGYTRQSYTEHIKTTNAETSVTRAMNWDVTQRPTGPWFKKGQPDGLASFFGSEDSR